MGSNVSMIVAMAEDGTIGDNNKIPWRISEDFKYFKKITLGKPIIMGRKTWESLPKKPLPKRDNIVISRDWSYKAEGAITFTTLTSAIISQSFKHDEIVIIGGSQIYTRAIKDNMINKIYLTRIYDKFDGDTKFPIELLSNWKLTKGEIQGDETKFSFDIYEKI